MTRRSLALSVLVAALWAVPAAAAPLGFDKPVYVDQHLAGGEPVLLTDSVHHDIIYSTHEGTTHIYRPGLASSTTFDFASGYRNQVNVWTSRDEGRTWKVDDFGGKFTSNPAQNSGFSDPDLTQDAGGRVYNTGINLANDSLFSSNDGGVTWDRGTAQCHDGDRPWLAGAAKDDVFLATNVSEGDLSHQIFESTDGGNTCSATGIPDAGTLPDGTKYTGNGKLYYDPRGDRLVEPVNFMDADGHTTGIGVGTWKRGDRAFTPHLAAKTSIYAHWAAIALDDAGGLYLTYDNDPHQAGTAGGCDTGPSVDPDAGVKLTNNGETPAPNQISLIHSGNFGTSWDPPTTIARPDNARVLWPWVAAGDAGKVSVVWYQTDKIADLACQPARLSVMAATVTGANTGTPSVSAVDAVGHPIADNNICQNGTLCVATGEDRRLGDFFTNAIDEEGCAIIGTADSSTKDPVTGGERSVALPLFVRQNAGAALRGGGDCSGRAASLLSNSTRKCASRRSFKIRLHTKKADPLVRATVYVNGRRVRTLKGKRLRAAVDLRGLPKGTFRVKVQGVTRRQHRVRDLRTYHTCVPKRASRK
jgi:hypothetical protein